MRRRTSEKTRNVSEHGSNRQVVGRVLLVMNISKIITTGNRT